MDVRCQQLVNAGLRYNTHRTYSSAQQQYLRFCNQFSIVPLPANECTLLRYIAHLSLKPGNSGAGLAASSIQVYLSAIRSLHVMHGYPEPPSDAPRVVLALKAIAASGPPPNQKSPIDYQLLCKILELVSPHDFLWRSVLLLGFAAGLRSAEYTEVYDYKTRQVIVPAPVVGSIQFGYHGDQFFMSYTVAKSKTTIHPFTKYISCNQGSFCPVCSMYWYLQHRSSTGLVQASDILFLLPNGKPLSKYALNSKIKQLVSAVGLDPKCYSSHSLRAGIVCTGNKLGLSQDQLAMLGNWRSDAYKQYIRDTGVLQLKLTKQILQS